MYDVEFELMAPCSTTGDQARRSFSFQIPQRCWILSDEACKLYLGCEGHGLLPGGRQVDAPSIEEKS